MAYKQTFFSVCALFNIVVLLSLDQFSFSSRLHFILYFSLFLQFLIFFSAFGVSFLVSFYLFPLYFLCSFVFYMCECVCNVCLFCLSPYFRIFSILCLTRNFIRQGHAREKRKVYRATRTRSQAIDRG